MASSSLNILIVGAGVLGLSTAATLRARGHAVAVVDPGGLNASAVAGGMIAPAMECALDNPGLERASLLRTALDLWPAFAAQTGVELTPAQAEWRGENWPSLAACLTAHGFVAEHVAGGVRAPDDLRLSPPQALARMAQGVEMIRGAVTAVCRTDDGWRITLDDGATRNAQWLILATGAETQISGLPPEVQAILDRVSPVRGQIGLVRQPLCDRTIRGPGGYVTPVDDGVLIGATMEAGRRDLAPEAATSERLLRMAEALLGRAIDPADVEWRVGLRGNSPDDQPMAGRAAPGLVVALAPRRNGWLIGPLIGAVVADAVEGRAPRPEAAAFDPLRFSPPAG